jgi:hypothetical protein
MTLRPVTADAGTVRPPDPRGPAAGGVYPGAVSRPEGAAAVGGAPATGAPLTPAGVPLMPAGAPITSAGAPITPAGVPVMPAAVPIMPAAVPVMPAAVPEAAPALVDAGRSGDVPPGADPQAWLGLTVEERSYFAQLANDGRLSYGPQDRAGESPLFRGRYLNIRV